MQVLKQKAAEIGGERLNTDPERVKVVALRDVANVIVEKQFLHRQMIVGTIHAGTRVHPQSTRLIGLDMVVLVRQRQAVLVIGWLEGGVALVIDQRKD